MALDSTGNVLITGYFRGTNWFGTNELAANRGDMFIASYDGEGKLNWVKSYGGAMTEMAKTYQWLFNGTALPGATAATLTLTNTGHAQAGFYSVVVSNQAGSVTSAVVQLLFNFLTLNFYAGLSIDGEAGQRFQVQFVPEFGGSNSWQMLTNVTLTTAPYLFIDPESPRVPRRIYRAIPIP